MDSKLQNGTLTFLPTGLSLYHNPADSLFEDEASAMPDYTDSLHLINEASDKESLQNETDKKWIWISQLPGVL